MEKTEPPILISETTPPLSKEEVIARLKAAGTELPTATQLVNLQTNNVFAEPGP